MNRLVGFSQNKIKIFSAIIILAALLIWSIEWDGDPYMGFDMILSHIITCVIAIWLMKKLSIWEKTDFKKEGLVKGLVLGIPFLVLGILSAVYSNLGVDYSQLGTPDIKKVLIFTASMFMVGAAEEIVFRSLLLNNMIKKWGANKNGVIKAITISALIFGGIHLINVFVAPPVTVVVQAINAACAGVLFSVIYIRCKNIWAVIIIHMLVDWIALFLQQCFTGTTSIVTSEVSIIQGLLVVLVGSVIPLLFSMILLRKCKLPVNN